MSDESGAEAPSVADEKPEDCVLTTISDGIAWITLNRPSRLNAWNPAMHDQYRRQILSADRDDQVRAIVVTGAGRGFCAGADFDVLQSHIDAGAYGYGSPRMDDLDVDPAFRFDFAFQFGLETPIVAMINGPVAGVGLVLACYCDFRFVSSEAKVTAAHGKWGLPPEFGLSWLLPRLVGTANAIDILVSSRVFSGREAAEMGLARLADDPEHLRYIVHDFVRSLVADVSPHSMAVSKLSIYEDLLHHDLGRSIELSVTRAAQMVGSAEYSQRLESARHHRAVTGPGHP